jgi:predicted glycosyltransferase
MRILFWVQHLLGTGHLKRAATVASALARQGLKVTLVSGGPPAPWLASEGIEVVQLPWIRARDLAFSALVDADDRPLDDALRGTRRTRLLELFAAVAPQAVITEMFPFGRRAFRFELTPLLEAIAGTRPRPWLVCSVRDILVQKSAPERYLWMRDLALAHYDRVLVHTDPALIPFGLTFPYADALGARLISTGYVVEPGPPAATGQNGEVLVSAGGGRVGQKLLAAALGARALSEQRDRPWRLIAGGELDPAHFTRLHADLPPGVVLERQRDDFQRLLAKCLLSVSQAGYNTVVEVLRLGKPMVLVPFATATETEQRVRAERLTGLGLAETVRGAKVTPSSLARAIDRASSRPAGQRSGLDLDGALTSARLIAALAARPAPAEPAG